MNEGSKSTSEGLKRLLTPADVAQLARLSEKTIYRAIEAGRLCAAKIGNRYRITPDDYRLWIESCRVGIEPSAESPRRRLTSAKVPTGGPGTIARLRAIEAGR